MLQNLEAKVLLGFFWLHSLVNAADAKGGEWGQAGPTVQVV